MFNDLLKMLEALLSGFRITDADKKINYESIGHHMLKIFLEVDNIVEQGKLFFTIMKKDLNIPLTVGVSLLVAMEESMGNLLIHIEHESLLPLAKVDLPNQKKFVCLLDKESGSTRFQIGQFMAQLEPVECFIDSKNFAPSPVVAAVKEKAPISEGGEIVEICQLPHFMSDTKMLQLSILGAEEQIAAAIKALQKIERLSSELRLIIINDFKFEDIF